MLFRPRVIKSVLLTVTDYNMCVCVCVCVCVYVYTYMYICTHPNGDFIGAFRPIRVDHTDFFKWLLKLIHSYMYICTHAYVYVCIYI
jgi:hypothetical protein